VAEVRLCAVADVAPGTMRRVVVDGRPVCVARIPGPDGTDEWYAIGDTCSHQDYPLSDGELWVEEREVECPKHGATFSLRTGEALTLPATRPVPAYPVRVDGDDVWVTLQ
jgi:3-phenylpropionate/trans-cinnamate dioxygenase ferredoxin subunit